MCLCRYNIFDHCIQTVKCKCKHVTIGNNNIGEIKYSMTLNNSIYPLDTIEKQNELGVIIDTKLSFDDIINLAINKRKKKKVIHRTFQFLDKDTFLPLYKTMVRRHLDYAIAVWYPYKKHITGIENVQRRATKELPGMKNLTYI